MKDLLEYEFTHHKSLPSKKHKTGDIGIRTAFILMHLHKKVI